MSNRISQYFDPEPSTADEIRDTLAKEVFLTQQLAAMGMCLAQADALLVKYGQELVWGAILSVRGKNLALPIHVMKWRLLRGTDKPQKLTVRHG